MYSILYYNLKIRNEIINVVKYSSGIIIEIGGSFSFAEKHCSSGCSGRGHVNISEKKLQ